MAKKRQRQNSLDTEQTDWVDQFTHGSDAIISSGFPHEFLAQVAEVATLLHCCISLRAGQPPNVGKGFDVKPKPMTVKTKTTSDDMHLPLLAGFIPMDQSLFARKGSKPIAVDQPFGESTLQVNLCACEI